MESDGVDHRELCVSDGPQRVLPYSLTNRRTRVQTQTLLGAHWSQTSPRTRPAAAGGPDLKMKQQGTRLPRGDRALWTDSRCLVMDASSCPTRRPSLRDPTDPCVMPAPQGRREVACVPHSSELWCRESLRSLGISPVSRPRCCGMFPLSSDGTTRSLRTGRWRHGGLPATHRDRTLGQLTLAGQVWRVRK